jgi:hypothetical protein
MAPAPSPNDAGTTNAHVARFSAFRHSERYTAGTLALERGAALHGAGGACGGSSRELGEDDAHAMTKRQRAGLPTRERTGEELAKECTHNAH